MPTINDEESALSDYEYKSDCEESEGIERQIVPHPNVNVARDRNFMEHLYPKCDFLEHPNIRPNRLTKYKNCSPALTKALEEQSRKKTPKPATAISAYLRSAEPRKTVESRTSKFKVLILKVFI